MKEKKTKNSQLETKWGFPDDQQSAYTVLLY